MMVRTMPPVTIVTPTRGRPVAFSMLRQWVANQCYDGDIQWVVAGHDLDGYDFSRLPNGVEIEVIPTLPHADRHSLCVNVAEGCRAAMHDLVVIMEDDDYYSPDYLAVYGDLSYKHELMGEIHARYYNIATRRFRQLQNSDHASLAQTAVRGARAKAALVESCRSGDPFVDLRLWNSFSGKRKLFSHGRIHVGIKGMPGYEGAGVGHRSGFGEDDVDLTVFREWGIPEAYLDVHKDPTIVVNPDVLMAWSDLASNPESGFNVAVTVAMVGFNQLELTLAAIESIGRTITVPWELIYWDNGSDDQDEVTRKVRDLAVQQPNLVVVTSAANPGNAGYIPSVNWMSRQAIGDWLVVTNNDVVFHDGWLQGLQSAFDDPQVAQAGPQCEFGYLGPDFRGRSGTGPVDYVDGFCFLMRTEEAVRLGPFDERNLCLIYGEDSDLSLRIQESGRKIVAVGGVRIDHIRNATIKRNPQVSSLLAYVDRRNREYLRKRWSGWKVLKTGRTPVLKVRRSGAHGDVLSCLPALKALRDRHPQWRLVFETQCGPVLEHCPYVDQVVDTSVEHDSEIDLDLAYEHQLDRLRPLVLCEAAGVEYPGFVPYWTSQASQDPRAVALMNQMQDDRPWIAIAPDSGWSIRRFAPHKAQALAAALAPHARVIEVGSRDWNLAPDKLLGHPWPVVATVLAACRAVVCTDNAIMHLACGVQVPTVTVFGCTDPSLVIDAPTLIPYQVSQLECLGCHHQPPFPKVVGRCHKPSLQCMDWDVDRLADVVLKAARLGPHESQPQG